MLWSRKYSDIYILVRCAKKRDYFYSIYDCACLCVAMKGDRKRLKAEKADLVNQMQQLYTTLESREEQLRDFIRNYDQHRKVRCITSASNSPLTLQFIMHFMCIFWHNLSKLKSVNPTLNLPCYNYYFIFFFLFRVTPDHCRFTKNN